MTFNRYNVIHQISEIIARESDAQHGLSQVLRLLAECSKSEWCSLFAYNKSANLMTLIASHGLSQELIGKLSFKATQGVTGHAIQAGSIINVSDAQQNPYMYVPSTHPEAAEQHALLVVPLTVGGRPIATLNISRRNKRKYTQGILNMMQEIATPLAVFILNTMLLTESAKEEKAFSFQRGSHKPPQPLEGPLKGTSVISGVVYGRAIKISGVDELLESKRLPLPVNTTPAAIEAEKKLFFSSVEFVQMTCRKTARELEQILTEADCDIFEMHAMLVDDPTLKETILKHIEDGHLITTALSAALRTFTTQYMKVQDEFLRERLCDIKDVLLNLKNSSDNLRGKKISKGEDLLKNEPKHIIVIAKELLPSQLVNLPLKKVTGIICEEGGATSHVAILARALQITMMVGVPGIFEQVKPNDSILLDCDANTCYISPNINLMRQFSEPLRMTSQRREHHLMPIESIAIPPKTADGQAIELLGNMAILSELPAIQNYGLSEIGLYRSEFLFMMRNDLPTEEEQFQIFKQLVTNANNVPVTIRLLDAGGDKPLPYLDLWENEFNPSLGWRGLRFLLSNPAILVPHLKAILRASALGPVKILIPMVADIFDLLKFKEILNTVIDDLKNDKIAIAPSISLGIMLEVPSAVTCLERMLEHIDFVSIGTNDLVQFMFAVDRGNPKVRQWYRQCHPQVFSVIKHVCAIVARHPGKMVSLCGELAGSKHALPLLLGAGIRRFSMTPSRAPIIRSLIPHYSIPECETLLDEMLQTCNSEMDVMAFLKTHAPRDFHQ